MLLTRHLFSLWAWLFIRLYQTVEAHSGYDFPWSPTKLLPFWGGMFLSCGGVVSLSCVVFSSRDVSMSCAYSCLQVQFSMISTMRHLYVPTHHSCFSFLSFSCLLLSIQPTSLRVVLIDKDGNDQNQPHNLITSSLHHFIICFCYYLANLVTILAICLLLFSPTFMNSHYHRQETMHLHSRTWTTSLAQASSTMPGRRGERRRSWK